MSTQDMILLSSLLASMGFDMPTSPKRVTRLGGRAKSTYPWSEVFLTKAERKGKSAEEIQQLRKEKWERKRNVDNVCI